MRHIFGVTGHSIFQITDAIYRESGIDFVPTQSELAAAYMAEGYGRAGRQLGVCLVSAGPGAANMLGGVAHAYKEWTPLLAISSDVSTKVAGKPANWHEIGQQAIFAPVTKRSATLQRPEDLPFELAAAIDTAQDGRSGPVYLGIPSDMQTAAVEGTRQVARGKSGSTALGDSLRFARGHASPGAQNDKRAPSQAELEAAVELLKNARAPLLIAGEGVYWAEAESDTLQLAELLQAPFGTPYSQKGLLAETHPLSLGVTGSGSAPFANQFCLDADLIVALGVSFGEGLTLGYGHRVIADGVSILQVDADPARAGLMYPIEVSLTGDTKQIVRDIIQTLQANGFRASGQAQARLERLMAAKVAWRAESEGYGSGNGPIDYWCIQRALREQISDDTIVVGAVTERMLQRFVATSKVFHTSDFRAIGHGLATAIGVKFARPDRQVVCLTGDGSFMMELPDLATLARNDLALPVLVVHNNAYGSMKHDQLRLFDGRFVGTDLYTPDFCQVAGAFGIASRRVDERSQLGGAIREVLDLRQPALLDIRCPVEGL